VKLGGKVSEHFLPFEGRFDGDGVRSQRQEETTIVVRRNRCEFETHSDGPVSRREEGGCSNTRPRAALDFRGEEIEVIGEVNCLAIATPQLLRW
jgi:hypothetical protein